MKHPFLINLLDVSECIGDYEDRDRDDGFLKESLRLYLYPTGPNMSNELTRSMFYAGDVAADHMAKRGFETLFVDGGEIELTVRNRVCHVTKGDIMHFGNYNPHRMHFVKDTPWTGFFHRMHVSKPMVDKALLSDNCPEMDDAKLTEVYRESYDLYHLEQQDCVECPKSEFPEVRTPEFAYETHEFCGDTMRLKVGRWETDGLYEVWEHNMKKGFYVQSKTPNPETNLFYVKSGKVRFNIFNNEFTAEAEQVVRIPPYGMYEFVVDEDAVMIDMTGTAMMQALISDYHSIQRSDPAKLEDPEFVKQLKEHYNCYITEFGCK